MSLELSHRRFFTFKSYSYLLDTHTLRQYETTRRKYNVWLIYNHPGFLRTWDSLTEITICVQGDPPPPKKKTEPKYFWLKFMNLILAFSFFQDMKSILCRKNWDHRIHQHNLVYQGKDIRIIFLYFCRSNKKVYGFCFFGGAPSVCARVCVCVCVCVCVFIYLLLHRGPLYDFIQPISQIPVTASHLFWIQKLQNSEQFIPYRPWGHTEKKIFISN